MKKKVNINRPEISSEEIAQRKNFDSVLKNHAHISKPFFKKPWFLSSVIIATVAIVTVTLLMNKDNSKRLESSSIQSQLAASNDSLALVEFYKTEQQKSCIHPPFAGVNIPYTTFKVDAEKGATLDIASGSKLTIPKNAFVDKNGKLLKGATELRYREFHDAVDFFVSGIPMTYDSAGVKYQFESAGMMEVLAYQDGKPVNMAKDKSINVELASNYKGTEYNLYKLDTINHNWSCLGKDKVVAKKTKPENEIVISRVNSTENKPIKETPEYKTLETKKAAIQKDKEIKITALAKPVLDAKKPAQSGKGKYTFNIEVDAKEFPELAVYKGALFEVGVENENFDKSMEKTVWDDASIKEGTKKGENYILTLKKGSKKYDLIVYPVFEGKNYETATKEYTDKFNKYTVALEKRKVDEKRIEDEYQAKLASIKQDQLALERKWKEDEARLYASKTTEERVMRAFTVNSFGVFNCDNPSKYPKGVLCTANLTNQKNVKLMCYEIYLVDHSRNGLFTYYKNPVAQFSFDPKVTNQLWTIENGVLYWLKPEQFSSINGKDGMSELQMTRVEQKFKSVDEIKTFFNL